MTYLKYWIPPAFLYFLNIWLTEQGLYGQFPNLDMPMHFIGGMFVCFSWFLTWIKTYPMTWADAVNTTAMVMVIAVAWEFYEFMLPSGASNQLDDTLLDLVMGYVGAWVMILGMFIVEKINAEK